MANNQHFDLLAPLYDRVISPPDPEAIRALLDLPADGKTAPGWMLDAGGGTGRVSTLLCSTVERLAISDLSHPMLRQAGQKGCVLPTQARVERLPFPDGAFQRILVVDAFHHFSDQPGAVAELIRVLAPSGRLLIEEPDIRSFGVKLIALGELLLMMNSRFRTPAWMESLLERSGLQASVQAKESTAWVLGIKP